MKLDLAWRFPALEGAWFEIAHLRETPAGTIGVAFDPRTGATVAFDVEAGAVRWSEPARTDAQRFRSLAAGPTTVLRSCALDDGTWQLESRDLATGEITWSTEVEARRIGRLFANQVSFFAMTAQNGRFVLLPIAQSDGTVAKSRLLDRGRGMVGPDGTRAWTRDRMGVTEVEIASGQRWPIRLGRGGVMAAGPKCLVTTLGPGRAAFVTGGELRWSYEVPPRDLTDLAQQDGVELEAGERDVWPPAVGRGVVDASPDLSGNVYLPDLNGSLHALRLSDGAPLWSAQSGHYPSSRTLAVPALLQHAKRAYVAWPASDECVYLVDAETGQTAATFELERPFEAVASASSEPGFVVLPNVGGLRVESA